MSNIQHDFIEFALEANVLRFGEFKTKAGRLSPYFFNAGLFNTGKLLDTKDHGEGGVIVGAPLQGRVVIIDDVISAGTSVRESVKIIDNAGAKTAGVLIALDRMEKGGDAIMLTETSAVQNVEQTFGFNVVSIITLNDLLSFMQGTSERAKRIAQFQEAVAAYRARYGA